jgi:RHS repeat-associated protein
VGDIKKWQYTSYDTDVDVTYYADNLTYTYDPDKWERTAKTTGSFGNNNALETIFGYTSNIVAGETRVSNLVNSLEFNKKFGTTSTQIATLGYTYDANGNVESVTKNGTTTVEYIYNGCEQLCNVYYPVNAHEYIYAYDAGGNITTRTHKHYGTRPTTTTDTFTYGDSNWTDKLTSATIGGTTYNLTYDAIGNPLSYFDATLTWKQGRVLNTYNKGSTSISYKYNAYGLRVKKTVGNTTTSYFWDENKLIEQTTGSDKLWFLYDSTDDVVGFIKNSDRYFYMKSLQGDVIGIVDQNGTVVALYDYDSWGKALLITDGSGNDVSANAAHIANVNPVRYRGYFFDTETGYYYLQTRYYDPAIGRFLNADRIDIVVESVGDVMGANIFAYCNNNPIALTDPTGEYATKVSDKGISHIKNAEFGAFYDKHIKVKTFYQGVKGITTKANKGNRIMGPIQIGKQPYKKIKKRAMQALNTGADNLLTLGFGHTYIPAEAKNGDIHQFNYYFDPFIKVDGKYVSDIKLNFYNTTTKMRIRASKKAYDKSGNRMRVWFNIWIPLDVCQEVLACETSFVSKAFLNNGWNLEQWEFDAIASFRHTFGPLSSAETLYPLLEKTKNSSFVKTTQWRNTIADLLDSNFPERLDGKLFKSGIYQTWKGPVER